jgi:hypothetical protein
VRSTFYSVDHPNGMPAGMVYAQWIVTPLGACTLPIMIGATASALEGNPIWGYLVWGFPAALVAATLWSHFALVTTPAELHLRSGQCAIRSVADVLRDRPLRWSNLYDVSVSTDRIEISLGWTTRLCRREDWPEFAELRDASNQAVQAHLSSSPAS